MEEGNFEKVSKTIDVWYEGVMVMGTNIILKWEMIQKLWIDPDLTMVFYTWNGYTTIPTSQIPAEALDFLVGQVEGAGGSVVDNKTART